MACYFVFLIFSRPQHFHELRDHVKATLARTGEDDRLEVGFTGLSMIFSCRQESSVAAFALW